MLSFSEQMIWNSWLSWEGVGHQISVKRLRSAAESSFLPKSPPGFMVEKMRKLGWATSREELDEAFPATSRVRSSSRTLLRRSRTESSAREISSMRKSWPSRRATTRGPSCHSNSWVLVVSLGDDEASVARTGRMLPKKSSASECMWQLMMLRCLLLMRARIWQMVVLPMPVSPTSRKGSLNL